MAVRDNYDSGPTHGFEAKGYSAAYDKARPKALHDLEATLAGPKPANAGRSPSNAKKTSRARR